MLEMCCKGHTWANKQHALPLSHSEAWTSFTLQLYLGMCWGLSTVVLLSHELYKATRLVYYKCLPLLGVQQHIKLPWRMLPEAYQGIGLPNFTLHSLASKLQLIQCIWGFNNAGSCSLLMGYELLPMDIGMYRNSLGYSYNWYLVLATNNTWFKNVWELLHDFDVKVTFGEDYQLHPIHEGDYFLIDLFSRHYSGADLASLNVFCQHKHVIHVSCIVFCDGQTINTDFLSMVRGHSDRHKFPLQLIQTIPYGRKP
jgi:hypothetical protein